jgi:uncharacterized membrane-anchored protein
MRTVLFALAGFLFLTHATLRADNAAAPHLSADDMNALASSLKYQTGTITLKDGLAKIALAPGYRFLDGADAEKVLHDLWGNPPADPPLGMIFPPQMGPMDRDGWGVIVDYENQGHVNDADAAKIDYTDLLKKMQQGVQDSNEERQKEGYPAMQLVGWAEPPHYDAATHKLYWAKDLRESNENSDGLNYEIRVLGRQGTLDLTAVAGMGDLPSVSTKMPDIMAMVDFKPGHTYAEFNPKIDTVAKYGIAGLIAGSAIGLAAKAGLLKFLFPLLVVLKHYGIVVVVAIVAFFKKMAKAIKGKSSVERPFQPPQQHEPSVIPPPRGLNPPPEPSGEPLRPPVEPGSGDPPGSSF